MAARKLLKKVLQSIVQDFCVVDVLGCLKGTRALTPCRAPRPTQDPKPIHNKTLALYSSLKLEALKPVKPEPISSEALNPKGS